MKKSNSNLPRCYSYIRFSTPEQLKGDSLRRQQKLSEEYAKANGMILDKTLKLEDSGLSAFSGKNFTEGALGKFIEHIKNGDIPEGSVLLVESLDRLSRENAADAFSRFYDIIQYGIKIITLGDGNIEYSKKSLKENKLMLFGSILIMTQANEESEAKSKRLLAVWDHKRKNASTKPLTSRLPEWLRLNKNIMLIEPIEDRCEVVKKIFEMSAEGIGVYSITRYLNEQQIKTWNKKNGWHKSYIAKILHNRAVIGEFQPKRKKNKAPVGDPIKNYFPAIISEDQFYQVQERLKENTKYGGKTGKVSNLFSHIAVCGYCGRAMVIVNKGKPPKGGTYLVCGGAARKFGCKYTSFPYSEFEEAFLTLCNEINLEDLILDDGSHRLKEINFNKKRLQSVKGLLAEVGKKINNLSIQADMAENPEQIKNIIKRQKVSYEEQATLKEERKKITRKINQLEKQDTDNLHHLNTVKKLIPLLKKKTGEDLIVLRLKIRNAIRELVHEIKVFPNGEGNLVLSYDSLSPEYTTIQKINNPVIESIKAFLKGVDELIPQSQVTEAKNKLMELESENINYPLQNTGRDKRSFHIFFKSKAFKTIRYNPEEGYFIDSEINEKNFRIGDNYQVKGNFIKEKLDDESKAAILDNEKATADFEKRVKNLINSPSNLSQKADYKKVIYNPFPEKKHIADISKRIVKLRNKGMKWSQIKEILEAEKIKTANGNKTWHAGTLSRIYRRASS